MKRILGVVVMVGALLALAGLPALAIVLRYAPEVGAQYLHATTMYMDAETEAGTGSPMTIKMEYQLATEYTVLEKTPEGVKEAGKLYDGKVVMAIPGMKEKQTQAIPETTFSMLLDERGAIHEPKVSSDDPTAAAGAGNMLSAMSSFATLPEKDIKPGDTWSDTIKIPASNMMPAMDMTVNSRLMELTTYQEHPCAKIAYILRGAIDTATPVAMKGTMQGVGTGYYDYQRSVWIEQTAKVTMNMDMTMPAADSSAPQNIKMNMKMDMKTVLTNAIPPAKDKPAA